jgi:3-polyprenyl-4-hydroxybenzoate decarboxylase
MFAVPIIKQLLKSNIDLIIISDAQAEKSIAEESLLKTFEKEAADSQLIILTTKDEWDFWSKGMVVLHIYLRNLVDSFLLGPMSANVLAKMANGLCDDLLVRIYITIDVLVQSVEFRKATNLHSFNAF